MGIYQHKGRHGIRYQWKFQHQGKVYNGTFDTDDKRVAKDLFALKKAEIRRGRVESKTEKAELLTTFLDEYLKTNRANTHIVAAIRTYFKGKRLDEITLVDCQGFQQWRLEINVRKQSATSRTRKRSPRTVNREFAVLSGIFRFAIERRRISVNPCKGVASLKFTTKLPQIWTREQAARAIAHMVDVREHLLPLVLVVLQTGLSRKDLFLLKAGEVMIEGERGMIAKQRAKTGAQITIPLNSVAIQVLGPLIEGKKGSEYVFLNPTTGKPYSDVRHSLDTVCRLAKVPRITWHKLRHCVGTWLAEDGAGIEVIARFLSHRSYRSTQVYVHLAAQKILPQAESLGAWVKENEGENVEKTSKMPTGGLRLVS